jgi:S1-C subfamily serine protease
MCSPVLVFFVSKDYLLTNAHVVLKGSGEHAMSEAAIQITGNNYGKTRQFVFDLVSADSKLDIAVLKLQEGTNEFVSFSQNIFNGEQVFAIGNSRGEGLCIVEGIVSDISRTIDSNQLFMTSAIVTNGNSGCPVFSSDGLLLGMITEGSKLSVAMNYAIPSYVLLDFIRRVEKKEEITIL